MDQSVRACIDTHPVNALSDRELCRSVMAGKLILKAHDAVGRCATASAGDGHLGCKLAAGKLSGTCCDTVFTHGDRSRFCCCRSKNHQIKIRASGHWPITPENKYWHALMPLPTGSLAHTFWKRQRTSLRHGRGNATRREICYTVRRGSASAVDGLDWRALCRSYVRKSNNACTRPIAKSDRLM